MIKLQNQTPNTIDLGWVMSPLGVAPSRSLIWGVYISHEVTDINDQQSVEKVLQLEARLYSATGQYTKHKTVADAMAAFEQAHYNYVNNLIYHVNGFNMGCMPTSAAELVSNLVELSGDGK